MSKIIVSAPSRHEALISVRNEISHRTPGAAFTAASTDSEAIVSWMSSYTGHSKRTLDAYFREATRFLRWSNLEMGKSFMDLMHEDFGAYEMFLRNPQPVSRWVAYAIVGGKRRPLKRGRSDEGWLPFTGPLSEPSITYSMGVISALFKFLAGVRYLDRNPTQNRRVKKQKQVKIERFLSNDEWRTVLSHLERMREDSPEESLKKIRARWLFRLFYLAGMRISEVSLNGMSSLTRLRSDKKTDQERFFLRINGKGNKDRDVPVGEDLLGSMFAYRRSLGLPNYPQPGENYPLVSSIRGGIKMITRQALHNSVKEVFDSTSKWLEGEGGNDNLEMARNIGHASAHWIRHTSGTNMANNNVPPGFIRDFLGHADLKTASLYIHSEKKVLHDKITSSHRLDSEHRQPSQGLD